MTRKQRHAVAVATTVLTLAGGGGVAWACTGDPGYPGSTGTTTTSGTDHDRQGHDRHDHDHRQHDHDGRVDNRRGAPERA